VNDRAAKPNRVAARRPLPPTRTRRRADFQHDITSRARSLALERPLTLRRRQYDAVEPENRLVAKSLERVWEDKLRQVEQIEIEYESWRRQQLISLAAADRAQIISLGEDLFRSAGN